MRTGLLALVAGFVASCGLARADQPAPPKPGPEHEMLKKFVGEWDAAVDFGGQKEKATAVYKMEIGGFWLTEYVNGEFGGQKFEGRATTGYDPLKKKYVSTWVDSMGPQMLQTEGAFDKDGKTYTETGDMAGDDGKPVKLKSVFEFPEKDKIIFTMYSVKDGKDQQMMQIVYKRKK
jgi:hypothetical protein